MTAFLNIPKELLEDLYLNKHLSTWKIANILDCARSTVYAKAISFKIPIRTLAESHIIYPRKDFSGNLIEKAYLIGFRIGDLRARKCYKNSETIMIDCGSTKIDQINLIKALFSCYGRVWIGKLTKRGCIQIQCHLNDSFNFLITKDAADWLFNRRKYFFAFLAGFTDAEGSIYLSNNQAHYGLGNCDLEILQRIKSSLEKYNINCHKISRSARQGLIGSYGYRYNHDYWILCISRKVEMLKLLNLIGPHLKHKNRIRQMRIAIKNIEERDKLYGQK